MALTRAIATPLGEDSIQEVMSAPDEAAMEVLFAAGRITSLKQGLARKFEDENIARNQALVPEWNSLAMLQTIASIWNTIMGSATTNQIVGHSTHLFARDTAIPRVLAMVTEVELLTVDAFDPDPFGDGTLWPT